VPVEGEPLKPLREPEQPLDEQQRSYAEAVELSGEALLSIINDILDISKIESGNFELAPDEISLHEVAQASAELVRARIAEKKQRLDVMLPERLPLVNADKRVPNGQKLL
jgi:signal transduction histidine kinase